MVQLLPWKNYAIVLITVMCEIFRWFHVGYIRFRRKVCKSWRISKMHKDFSVSCWNQRLQSPLHSLSKPKCCFGHSYFSTNMQVIIKRTYISKTWLPVLCWTGCVQPILLGKDGRTNQDTQLWKSDSDVSFFYSVLLEEQILQVPGCIF